MRTFAVGVSAVATSVLLVEAETAEQAEDAASQWLTDHNPEDQKGNGVQTDEWDVETGSAEVWREGSVADSIKAGDVLKDAEPV